MSGLFYIKTMGCQMNDYDSDYLARLLVNRGLSRTDSPEGADLILINTCTVRSKPEQKAYSFLGRMASLKRRNPELILGMMGCLAQMKGPELLKRFPYLDMVVGPRELPRFREILDQVLKRRSRIVATSLELEPPQPVQCSGYFSMKVSANLSIMEGCNNFCTYCIVPHVRGREISRPPAEIMREAQDLIDQGVREITLLGQNVNSYLWKGEGKGCDFPGLLQRLGELEGLLRMRFTTSHPKDLSEALMGSFGSIEKLCGHIHLPFQSGSNRILKRMGRGYTRERYLELIHKLRDLNPEIAITSDVMVGFPGETEEDFLSTLDLIKDVEFDSLFSFKYSDREGTSASTMAGKVDEDVKSSRLNILQELQKGITLKKNSSLVGRELEVLIEGPSKRGGELTGRTTTNNIVNFNCDTSMIGHLANVIVEYASLNSLRGRVVD